MKAAKQSGVITSWLAFSITDPALEQLNWQLLDKTHIRGNWVRKNSSSAAIMALYGVKFNLGSYNDVSKNTFRIHSYT